MIIDCISDLHGFLPKLEGGDLLIVSGDLTARDSDEEHYNFIEWLALHQKFERRYKKVIYIAGNHDGFLDPKNKRYSQVKVPNDWNIEYLCDAETSFQGLKIWGSPWTPTFLDWHFMKNRGEEIKQKWDLIPDDTDILITHGPPFGIQDQVQYSSKAKEGKFAGCEELRDTLERLKKLKLHVFGHVHEGYGKVQVNGVIYVNASIMNEHYIPLNKPIRIEL